MCVSKDYSNFKIFSSLFFVFIQILLASGLMKNCSPPLFFLFTTNLPANGTASHVWSNRRKDGGIGMGQMHEVGGTGLMTWKRVIAPIIILKIIINMNRCSATD